MSEALWSHDEPVSGLDIDVPAWIDQDIDGSTVAAVNQGGCASGAYMPAVTYHLASTTMAAHGDDVLQYIEDALGDLPAPDSGESWSGMAVHYLSGAVELWCATVEQEIVDALEAEEDDDS